MQDFLNRTTDQTLRRAEALPENAQQHIQIDLRGQEVSPETLESIQTDLAGKSDGVLQPELIKFKL